MSVFRVGSNKSSVNNFPTVRPTLDLDFANSKTLDPRIEFTRSSGGSYVGADGLIKYAGVNEARFDHDPVTGESLGLLIEEGRTNLVQDSEDVFKYSIKVKTNYSLNQIVAPDGTTTADKIYNDTTTGEHYIEDVLSSGLSGNFTHSVFVKAAEYTKVVLRPVHIGESTNTSGCMFDLSNETTTTPGGIGSNASIQKFPNGWYRISMTLTLTGANTYNAFRLHLRENESSILDYTGDGTSGFYIWGAQVEAGSFPTSYIPTQGSTRTRSVDSVEINDEGELKKIFNPNSGSIFVSFKPVFEFGNGLTSFPSFANIFQFQDNTKTYNIRLGSNGTTSHIYFPDYVTLLDSSSGSTYTFKSVSSLFDINTTHNIFFSYGYNYLRLLFDSENFSSNSPLYNNKDILISTINGIFSNHIPTILTLGKSPGAVTNRFNMRLKRFQYYSRDLGSEQGKLLTRPVTSK